MTIVESIITSFKAANKPLSVAEVYDYIIKNNLYNFNAREPKSIVRQQIRRHCIGISFPSALPNKFFIQVDSARYDLYENSKSSLASFSKKDLKEKLAEEGIQEFHKQHILETKSALIDKLLSVAPEFFEQLVLELLMKMGYGTNGSIAKRRGGPDGGIDGEILQDRLGFDRIYTQAKRYNLGRAVQEKEVRDFVGALQNITKGVFITTSRFTSPAIKYAQKQQQKNLVLIDGEKLAKLMIEFELGVQAKHNYLIYQLDTDYFGEV